MRLNHLVSFLAESEHDPTGLSPGLTPGSSTHLWRLLQSAGLQLSRVTVVKKLKDFFRDLPHAEAIRIRKSIRDDKGLSSDSKVTDEMVEERLLSEFESELRVKLGSAEPLSTDLIKDYARRPSLERWRDSLVTTIIVQDLEDWLDDPQNAAALTDSWTKLGKPGDPVSLISGGAQSDVKSSEKREAIRDALELAYSLRHGTSTDLKPDGADLLIGKSSKGRMDVISSMRGTVVEKVQKVRDAFDKFFSVKGWNAAGKLKGNEFDSFYLRAILGVARSRPSAGEVEGDDLLGQLAYANAYATKLLPRYVAHSAVNGFMGWLEDEAENVVVTDKLGEVGAHDLSRIVDTMKDKAPWWPASSTSIKQIESAVMKAGSRLSAVLSSDSYVEGDDESLRRFESVLDVCLEDLFDEVRSAAAQDYEKYARHPLLSSATLEGLDEYISTTDLQSDPILRALILNITDEDVEDFAANGDETGRLLMGVKEMLSLGSDR